MWFISEVEAAEHLQKRQYEDLLAKQEEIHAEVYEPNDFEFLGLSEEDLAIMDKDLDEGYKSEVIIMDNGEALDLGLYW